MKIKLIMKIIMLLLTLVINLLFIIILFSTASKIECYSIPYDICNLNPLLEISSEILAFLVINSLTLIIFKQEIMEILSNEE